VDSTHSDCVEVRRCAEPAKAGALDARVATAATVVQRTESPSGTVTMRMTRLTHHE
jgi:hypothetical protein